MSLSHECNSQKDKQTIVNTEATTNIIIDTIVGVVMVVLSN